MVLRYDAKSSIGTPSTLLDTSIRMRCYRREIHPIWNCCTWFPVIKFSPANCHQTSSIILTAGLIGKSFSSRWLKSCVCFDRDFKLHCLRGVWLEPHHSWEKMNRLVQDSRIRSSNSLLELKESSPDPADRFWTCTLLLQSKVHMIQESPPRQDQSGWWRSNYVQKSSLIEQDLNTCSAFKNFVAWHIFPATV